MMTPTEFAELYEAVGGYVELRLDYSGRGMYGKTCVALVGNDHDIVCTLMDMYKNCEEDYEYDLTCFEIDCMGTDSVYYFRGIGAPASFATTGMNLLDVTVLSAGYNA